MSSQFLSGAISQHARRGQALVELAVVLPVMLLFMGGVLDLSRAFYAQISVTNAAREGALQAARSPTAYIRGQDCTSATTDTNRVVCRVQLEGRGSVVTIPASRIEMSCQLPGCPANAGSTVTVTVSGQLELALLHFLFASGRVDFGASSTAQIEYLPVPPLPAPTPGPSASGCTVPDLIRQRKNDAQGIWSSDGFTSHVAFAPGNGNYVIGYQSVAAGTSLDCGADIMVGP